jgi:hypothetical protein
MVKINNHLFENLLRKELLKKYKYFVFETNEIEIVKQIFKARFLKDLPVVQIRRPIEDPIVNYYDNLGYRISYTWNFDGTENYNIVIIDVPSIDINEFKFEITEIVNNIKDEDMLFISKYQILWDKIFLNYVKYDNSN